jgi:hypothetical protein
MRSISSAILVLAGAVMMSVVHLSITQMRLGGRMEDPFSSFLAYLGLGMIAVGTLGWIFEWSPARRSSEKTGGEPK